jgi:hypothetical protein
VRSAGCALLLCLVLSGCGYVGPVVPPSPQIPNQITDLAVAEDGADIVVSFTTPARTLDNLAIERFSVIELRIGPDVQPMDVNRWADNAREFDLPLPPPNEKGVARPAPIRYKVPAAEWIGKRIAVAVRTAVKRDKDYSNWSNFERLDVIAPLAAPVLTVKATAQGYDLTWNDEGPGVTYRVFRQGANDQTPGLVGTSDKPEFVDRSAQFDVPYTYSVIAAKGATESPVSNKIPVNAHDIFPPAAPTGLTGIATGNAVELSWQRNPEPDMNGYFVYRSTNGGPFERQGGLINLPAYTDSKVQHGATYRYEVSAVDRTNNEGDKTAPLEIRFP